MTPKSTIRRFLVGKFAVAVTVLVAGFFAVSTLYTGPESQATAAGPVAAPESFTSLAEKNSPAVVNIRSERNGKSGTGR